MRVAAVVPAAGRGSRLGHSRNKIWCDVGGQTILQRSVRALVNSGIVDAAVIVVAEAEMAEGRRAIEEIAPDADIVAGGATRAESVLRGLQALPSDADIVLVHDAARPFLSTETVVRVVGASAQFGAAIPGLAITDSIRRVNTAGEVIGFVERDGLWSVQTPQGARTEWLRDAYAIVGEPALAMSDEAAILTAAGRSVHVVEGDPANMKVTTPLDLEIARLAAARTELSDSIPAQEARTGLGYDVHQLDEVRALWLGGVLIRDHCGLRGHSDADVVLHAITDAILGAACLGDIGMLFPDTDPVNSGRRSCEFVRTACELASADGWRVVAIDVTVVAEEPKIGPHREAMREAVAAAAGVAAQYVNIKATTSEGMGFVGRREGIASWAVASLQRTKQQPNWRDKR